MKLPDYFFTFFESTEKEDFLASRKFVVNHVDYSPYSDDLQHMNELLEEKKFTEVISYENINTLLSARAHFMMSYAYEMTNDLQGAKVENLLGGIILQCMSQTGDGSRKHPFLVLRVEDENDMMQFYLNEEKKIQHLIHDGDLTIDSISTKSGKEIFFDITDAYQSIQKNIPSSDTDIVTKKKRWKFW